MDGSVPPRLDDLVAPLSAADFVEGYWARGRAHLSRARPSLVERVKSIEALADVEALLARHRQDVRVFGPRSFRSIVSPRAALGLLSAGFNLYITGVDETVPEARSLFAEVARDLGMAPWQLHVEAFAGRAGGVSSRHYDHDLNFQIMLDGEKEWSLEENRHIHNPLQSFHPAPGPSGEWSGHKEEAYAASPGTAMATAFDPDRCERLRAVAGTSLFLPRGCWHETRSITDTWSVNLVLRSVTWARAIGKALEIRLHRQPEFRAYCGGVPGEGRALPPTVRASQLDAFRTLQEAAITAIRDLTMDEAALSLLAFVGRTYGWSPGAAAREVIRLEGDGSWALSVAGLLGRPWPLRDAIAPVMARLCALREPFTWSHALALAGGLPAAELHELIVSLVEAGLLDERS